MKPFMDSDFLLQTDTAKKLYHDYAKQVPVLDYHCHLVPKEIADDIHFKNMTELWLGADHYKWRVMRSNGVDERFITGMPPMKKSSMLLQKPCQTALVIRCIIGVTWNYKDISA